MLYKLNEGQSKKEQLFNNKLLKKLDNIEHGTLG